MLSNLFLYASLVSASVVGISCASIDAAPGVGAGSDTNFILNSGKAFATNVSFSFIAQAKILNEFSNTLAASQSKPTSPLYGVSSSLITETQQIIQHICHSLTTVATELNNDIIDISNLVANSTDTSNGYLIFPQNAIQSFLGIVLNLESVTYTLASDLATLGGNLLKMQLNLNPNSPTSSDTLFNGLFDALQQTSNSFNRGGNDWTAVEQFLQNMSKTDGSDNYSSSSSAIDSNVSCLKSDFINEVGSHFADMMTAFNSILSGFLAITQQINNLKPIL